MKTEQLQRLSNPKRPYSRISFKKKVNLVKLVFRKGVTIDQAISQLGFKKTTAVNIINKFKELGYVPMRKYKRVYRESKDPLKKEQHHQTSQIDEYCVKNNGDEHFLQQMINNQPYQALKQEPDDPADNYRFY